MKTKSPIIYITLGIIATIISANAAIKGSVLSGIGAFVCGIGILIYLLRAINPETEQTEIDSVPYVTEEESLFHFNEEGFSTSVNDKPVTINWQSIQTIIGYKVDLVTTDCICIDIFCDNNIKLTTDEEVPGWAELLEQLHKQFPVIDQGWYIQIMKPAFATNLTLIYDKANRTLEEVCQDTE
ncbi:MAG: hypothetical protein QM731_28930 [Chitinophagaceae bacterium]